MRPEIHYWAKVLTHPINVIFFFYWLCSFLQKACKLRLNTNPKTIREKNNSKMSNILNLLHSYSHFSSFALLHIYMISSSYIGCLQYPTAVKQVVITKKKKRIRTNLVWQSKIKINKMLQKAQYESMLMILYDTIHWQLKLSLPGSVYSDRESRPPTAPATLPSPSVAPVEKPPSASCAWVEPWSRWASGEYCSRGGNSLREEPKKAGPSWEEVGGRLGEYGGRSPTAVLGRLVGMAPWTGF